MGPIRPHHALPSGHRWHTSSAVFNVSNLLPFGGEVRLWDSPLLVEIPQLLAASHDDMDYACAGAHLGVDAGILLALDLSRRGQLYHTLCCAWKMNLKPVLRLQGLPLRLVLGLVP